MIEIIGIEEKKGEYEGHIYDNLVLHCVQPFDVGKGFGTKVRTYKVKRRVLAESIGKELTETELSSLIGQSAEFYFDEYRNVKYVITEPAKE